MFAAGIWPPAVTEAIARLEAQGFEAFAVGGCVRDLLLGREPKDWDVATSARPAQTRACFSGEHVIETGLKHGTLTVVLDGMPLEITTYRVDGAYSDHRRPDQVVFTQSLREDLARRDLTINAMALHPQKGLFDPFGGRADLQCRIIRCVGEPERRFEEDALRILRCLRFSSVLDFTIESATGKALLKKRALLAHVSPERIARELFAFLCGARVRPLLTQYREVFAVFLPEIRPCFDFNQKNPYHHLDVWEHIALSVENGEPDPVVRLALLLHDVGKPARFTLDEAGCGHFYGHPGEGARMAAAALRRLRFDRHTAERVETLVHWHDADLPPEPKTVRRWLGRIGPEALEQLTLVKEADALAHHPKVAQEWAGNARRLRECLHAVLKEQAPYSLKDLAVNGRDLLKQGVPEGREVGALLQQLLAAVIDGKVENERGALLALLSTLRA